MPSLMELVDRVNKGESIDAQQLELYEDSANSAEKFLSHHAHASIELRSAHQHLMQSLEAIDFSDQKVLNQFVAISGFLGLSEQRAHPIVRFGASAIGRREYALGMEAIASALAYDLTHEGLFTSDRDNCLFVASQYERISQSVGFTPAAGGWINKQIKVAYITSSVADDEPSGKAISALAKHLDPKRFGMSVYSTEAFTRRDKQQFAPVTYVAGSAKRAKETFDFLGKLKVGVWLAPTDGDCLSAAKAMAEQMVKDRVDVAIFDTTQADAIASVLAGWGVARVKINLARRSPMYASSLDCVTYLDQVRYERDKEFWQHKNIDSRFILEGIDTDETMGAAPQRAAFGIPEQAVVLATAGSHLDATLSEPFVQSIIELLRAHPQAIYLVVGDAPLAWQKRKFEACGVGKRVGYAGRRKDLPSFLRIADIYLAEFPASGPQSALMAMAVEKPVVALRWGDEVDQSQAATFIGNEAAIHGRDPAAYVERVGKLIKDSAARQKLGKTLRQRVEQHFAFNQTTRLLEQLCEQSLQGKIEADTSMQGTERDPAKPLAQVA